MFRFQVIRWYQGADCQFLRLIFFKKAAFIRFFLSINIFIDPINALRYELRIVTGKNIEGSIKMSIYSKYFSLVIFGGLSFASTTALGMTTTNTDELYAESLKLERSSAEVPTSIDAGTANSAAIQEDYVVESVGDLENAPAAPKVSKKVSALKIKKNAKN